MVFDEPRCVVVKEDLGSNNKILISNEMDDLLEPKVGRNYHVRWRRGRKGEGLWNQGEETEFVFEESKEDG